MGDNVTMIIKTSICLIAILLGLYVAWWASSLANAIYLEKVDSFDDLSEIMLAWFVIAATVFCPIFCWTALRILKRVKRERGRLG